MSLPNRFESKEDYDDWIDDQAEVEIEEFLDFYDEEIEESSEEYGPSRYVPRNAIHDWVSESPQFGYPDWKLARLYDDVERYSDATVPTTEIVLPAHDPWYMIAQTVSQVLVEDVSARVQEMLKEQGYDVE